jgi:hypothetical protein
MALSDYYLNLSGLGEAFTQVTVQGLFYDIMLPMFAVSWAFYALLGRLHIFEGSKVIRAVLGGVFGFIATFTFGLGFIGFWAGMVGVVLLGVRGWLWKFVGMAALIVMFISPTDILSQPGIINALGGFFIVVSLAKIQTTRNKIIALLVIATAIILGNTLEVPEIDFTIPGAPISSLG